MMLENWEMFHACLGLVIGNYFNAATDGESMAIKFLK